MSVRLVQLRVVSTAAIAAASSIATGVLAHALGLGDAGLSYLHAVPLACALGIGVFFVAAAVEHRIEQRAVAFAKRLRAREPIVASSFPVSLDPVHHELLELGAELRRHERERADGEALLASIVEGTPAALVLLSSRGTVLATNEASRSLFFDGVNVTGRETVDLLRDTPAVFKRVLAATGDELLVLEDGEGVPHTYHLTKRQDRKSVV
jgi:hypothetical protein